MMNREKLVVILGLVSDGEITIDEGCDYVLDLFELGKRGLELIEWMSDCPYRVDDATIPRVGIEVMPDRVVGNMSLSYVKYLELCDIGKCYKN